MNQNYENDIKWFKEIINKPETLKLLPKQYLENPDFLDVNVNLFCWFLTKNYVGF